MREARQRSTAIDTAHVLGLSIAQYGAAFAASAIIARALGPTGRGAYYLPLLAATTATALGKLGLDQANVFLFGSAKISLGRLSAHNGLTALVSGVVLAGALTLLPSVLPIVFSGTSVSLLLLAGMTIPLNIHAQLSGALLAMTGAVRRQYVAGVSSGIVQIACAVLLRVLGRLTVLTALIVAAVGSAVTWAVLMAGLPRERRNWIGLDAKLLAATLKSSLVLHAGMILFFLHLRVDMYMVKAWLGTAALGQYSISVTIAEALMLATDAVAMAVLPTQIENTVSEAAERGLRVARVNALLGATLACGWAAVSWPAIRLLFGPAFTPAVLPMIVLLPGIVSLGVQRVCGAPMLRGARSKTIAGIYAATLTVNVMLNSLWIPTFGLVGASLASTISYVTGAVLFLASTSRLAHVPLTRAARFESADIAAISAAVRSVLLNFRGLVTPSRELL